MAGGGGERPLRRRHKREQMAAKGVGKECKRENERGRKIWIRLKKASSSLWGIE